MKRQQSPVFLALALSLLATNAWADPPPEPFTGGYLGGALGYAQHRVEVLNTQPGASAFGQTFKDTEGGVTVGAYAGYNWQCGVLLFGVETDFNYMSPSPTALDIEVFGANTETTSLESTIDWFGTLRGRFGYVINNNLLIYATGGLAYGRIDHKLSDDCPACSATPPVTGFPVSQSDSVTKAGWTLGGGAELLQGANWIVRAEALYVDLGSETHSYVFVIPPGTATSSANWDDQFWVARVGASYRFDFLN
jgi:outer membrane immunogenic protein